MKQQRLRARSPLIPCFGEYLLCPDSDRMQDARKGVVVVRKASAHCGSCALSERCRDIEQRKSHGLRSVLETSLAVPYGGNL